MCANKSSQDDSPSCVLLLKYFANELIPTPVGQASRIRRPWRRGAAIRHASRLLFALQYRASCTDDEIGTTRDATSFPTIRSVHCFFSTTHIAFDVCPSATFGDSRIPGKAHGTSYRPRIFFGKKFFRKTGFVSASTRARIKRRYRYPTKAWEMGDHL